MMKQRIVKRTWIHPKCPFVRYVIQHRGLFYGWKDKKDVNGITFEYESKQEALSAMSNTPKNVFFYDEVVTT